MNSGTRRKSLKLLLVSSWTTPAIYSAILPAHAELTPSVDLPPIEPSCSAELLLEEISVQCGSYPPQPFFFTVEIDESIPNCPVLIVTPVTSRVTVSATNHLIHAQSGGFDTLVEYVTPNRTTDTSFGVPDTCFFNPDPVLQLTDTVLLQGSSGGVYEAQIFLTFDGTTATLEETVFVQVSQP